MWFTGQGLRGGGGGLVVGLRCQKRKGTVFVLRKKEKTKRGGQSPKSAETKSHAAAMAAV